MKISNLSKVLYTTSLAVIDQKNTELFKLMIKAWNFATTLMTLRLTLIITYRANPN